MGDARLEIGKTLTLTRKILILHAANPWIMGHIVRHVRLLDVPLMKDLMIPTGNDVIEPGMVIHSPINVRPSMTESIALAMCSTILKSWYRR